MSTFRHPQATPSRNQTDFTMKAPKPPDRPLVPYMRYSRKMWSKVRAENPDAQLWDIGKIIGQMWRDISDADKAVYQHEYEIEKVGVSNPQQAEYEKAFKAYQNSHAYQQYINAKTRAKANEKSSRSRMEAGGVVIQPVDEEDAGNELSCRRLAAVRFDRNHRLIGDLFSPAIVTDTRTVVAQNRMDMLRKQAQSLSAHQNKLEEELVKISAMVLIK
ncbi:HMG box [Ancylostoma ceylanicum]|uniref:HMG box n=1 Tax=Ancylostoma ceylanicum TaxID=53326 RepID=A0A0D6M6B3_9BILA|nr:HMG box [Ancylostoma ceylanicum]